MPFAVEPSPEISDRVDFPLVANARGYRYAVEVGVDMAVFAKQFLDRWHGEYMHLVDAYGPDEFMNWDRSLDIATAAAALIPHHGRFKFVRAPSPACVRDVWWKVPPDFIYLDGDHRYAAVRADIEAWWPKLSDRGMLAGHDYSDDLPGVQQAVDEFARDRGLVVRLTQEPDFPHSWYIYRNEPDELIQCYFKKGSILNPHARPSR